MLTSKFENGKLVYVENAEYRDYCAKNGQYKGIVWSIPHKTTQERTLAQNSALHAFYEIWAKDLNEKGLTVQKVLSQKMEMDWTPKLMKEFWRDAQERLTGKKSTKDLDKISDINLVLDHFIRHFAEKFQGYELPPFPHDPLKQK